jgi:hypothetical protein
MLSFAFSFLFLSFIPGLMGSNILGALVIILFSASISYAIVYHSNLILYFFIINFIIACVLSFIHPYLPTEYTIYYMRYGISNIFFIWWAILLVPPVYDLYKYYNLWNMTVPVLRQSAGSSHKKRK